MSDTWSDIQAAKTKQSSMRAKLLERKRKREGMVAEMTNAESSSSGSLSAAGIAQSQTPRVPSPTLAPDSSVKTEHIKVDAEIKKKLLLVLCDINLDIPCNATQIAEHTSKMLGREVKLIVIEDLLQQLSSQQLLSIVSKESKDQSHITVTSLDLSKLSAVTNTSENSSNKRKRENDDQDSSENSAKHLKSSSSSLNQPDDSIESLLSMQSAKEREHKKVQEEILQLLSKPTAKEQFLVEKFSSQGGAQLQEFCQYGTKDECMKTNQVSEPCKRLHFRKIIHKHTDESLGDCSFLNTCFHMDTCKYVHYEIDYPEKKNQLALLKKELSLSKKTGMKDGTVTMFPPQWVQCDLRYFDMSVLGKCAVVMADPPWDIHMELPYGTMSDDEMRKLDVPNLQDDGFLFLWVTGRAMELGRECLELWGYKRVDELIWVKTNQLQRIIRTGRTGHWLNHGKEHCLVGVKGDPKGVNRGLDCDVIVAEVRATSHKPDEIYGIIERLSPGTRKVELFGRPHNVQPNWITLGNQVDGVRLKDPDVVTSFQKRYPNGNCMEPPK
ncbi:N6-adenosine-methyltransferase subunit METTL3-like [Octopus vulgaris]|uniref:mRNA m(6)A methyltransferase n=1 Tax=Octopus vulgaris TaxID=6645 RepID=A0AA36FF11_OCTVU|nr:N6-adenosine-methyltransferase subunit METTL3-like [Octopus vulgaris]